MTLGRLAFYVNLLILLAFGIASFNVNAEEPVKIQIATFKSQDCRNFNNFFSRKVCTTVIEDDKGNLIAFTGSIKYPATWNDKKVYLVPSGEGFEFVLVPEK